MSLSDYVSPLTPQESLNYITVGLDDRDKLLKLIELVGLQTYLLHRELNSQHDIEDPATTFIFTTDVVTFTPGS